MGKNLNRWMMKEMYEREEGDKIRSLAYIGLGQMFLTGSSMLGSQDETRRGEEGEMLGEIVGLRS